MDIFQTLKNTMKIVLFIGVVSLIVFIILIVVQYTTKVKIFSFINIDTVPVPIVTNLQSKVLASTRPITNGTTLDFGEGLTLKKSDFTLSFDCYLDGTYRSTTIPRVLLYNSNSSAVTLDNTINEYTGSLTKVPLLMDSTVTDILTKFTSANFIIYIDSVKNDLRVGVITSSPKLTTPFSTIRFLELLPPIENIPIRQPFQITMVLGTTFVEVYMNKELVLTYPIGSAVFLTTKDATNHTNTNGNGNEITTATTGIRVLDRATLDTTYKFYGPTTHIGESIKLGNIAYYNNILTGDQIRNLTPTLAPASFFKS